MGGTLFALVAYFDGCFQEYRGEAMHYLGYELPRILIPRTSVNKQPSVRVDCLLLFS